MAGIGIITNPNARENKNNPEKMQLLSYILGEHGLVGRTKSPADLSEVVEKFKTRQVKIIAINGGDGTITHALTAIVSVYGQEPLPLIAVLGGGTVNVLSTNLKLKGSPAQRLFRLVQLYASMDSKFETKELHCLKVENRFGFMFADGSAIPFLRTFYKNKSNLLASIFLLFQLLLSILFNTQKHRGVLTQQELKVKLHSSDAASEDRLILSHYFLGFISTLQNIAKGLRLFKNKPSDLLQIVWMQSKTRHVIPILFKALLNKESSPLPLNQENPIIRAEAAAVTLESEGAYAYTLDGEIYLAPSGQITLSIGPKIPFLLF